MEKMREEGKGSEGMRGEGRVMRGRGQECQRM